MEGTIDNTRFAFIEYYGAKLPDDSNQRSLIRLRAMRDVAETRKKKTAQSISNFEKVHSVNTLTPNSVATQTGIDSSSDYQSSRPRSQKQRNKHHRTVRQRWSPIQPPFTSTYSNLLVTENFSILNLAPLTGLRLGVTTLSFFTEDSTKVAQALSISVSGSQQFMSFIPSRYGQVLSLSLAADCIVAKLQQMITKSDNTLGHSIVLQHHNRALECIQHDLNDKSRWMSSETLCAIQLLGLFDLISNASLQSWLCHAAGASRLIEHRGPQNFKTNFDLALFAAQIGPIVTEAILVNRNCFLADDSWKVVICKAILCDGYFANHSDIMICLWTHLVWGPNHFKSTTDIITAIRTPSPQEYATLIEDMKNDSKSLLYLTNLLQTRLATKDCQIHQTENGIVPSSNGYSSQINPLEIQGTLILCRLMKLRLLFALAPARFPTLEIESQRLASQVMNVEGRLNEQKEGRMMSGLFMSQTTWIAKATIETHEIWKTAVGNKSIIDKWKFEAWCSAMGRKMNI